MDAEAQADRLFSQAIRWRGVCARCGDTTPSHLQCAHILSRRYRAIRWDPANAVCLCGPCHEHMTAHPAKWYAWVEGQHPGRWDELRAKSDDEPPEPADLVAWLTLTVGGGHSL